MATCNTCKFRDVNGGNEPCKSCVDDGGSVNNYQQAIDYTIDLSDLKGVYSYEGAIELLKEIQRRIKAKEKEIKNQKK